MVRILSQSDIVRALPMADAIRVVADAFRQLVQGTVVVPLRTVVETAQGDTLFMPAYLAQSRMLGVKVVSVRAGNRARGMPTVPALVALLDAETGLTVALMEGTYLTALRTGAASGVATDLLALDEARSLTVFGAGAQARTQVEAVCCVRSIQAVTVVSRTAQRAVDFARELGANHPELSVTVRTLQQAAAAVRDADIIVTATSSSTPVFPGDRLRPGAHVNAIGSYRPDMQEVDQTTVLGAKVVVDTREGVLAEAGDLLIPIAAGAMNESHIHAELGEIVAGHKPGREREQEITLFKSVGTALLDVAVAGKIWQQAQRHELGIVADW